MNENRIILPITPQTHIRSTKGDKIIFRIPTECRKLKGKKPCVKFRKTGECPHILSPGGRQRKRRLEKYNQYKVDLLEAANKAGFKMPVAGWAWYFYIPMPSSWTKKKKETMLGQFHCQKPDLNNLEKAAEDSLTITDELVAQRSGSGKFWIGAGMPGYIEILINQPIYNPFSVTFIDQDAMKAAPKRKWVKKDTPDLRRNRKVKPLTLERFFQKEDKIK